MTRERRVHLAMTEETHFLNKRFKSLSVTDSETGALIVALMLTPDEFYEFLSGRYVGGTAGLSARVPSETPER